MATKLCGDCVGNMGKIIGPLGLALIAGSSDYISPKATVYALGPAFLYFGLRGCYTHVRTAPWEP